MAGAKTCTQCRARKVRCDGIRPQCGPCQRSRRCLECTFKMQESGVKVHQGSLRKGAACLTCRRKKKRCDGKRPFCTTCSRSGRRDECYYDTTAHLYEQPTVLRSCRNDGPRSLPGADQETSIYIAESHETFSARSPQLTLLESASPQTAEDYSPSSSVGLDPNLCVSIMQHSPTAGLDSTYRTTFLSHLSQLGVYLSSSKYQAILHGDMTNTTIHPFFIHAAHLFGCYLYQQHRGTSSNLQDNTSQQMHLGLALSCIPEVGPDPDAIAQAYYLISLFYLYTHNLDLANRYFCDAAQVVKAARLGFNSTLSSIGPEGPSETTRERIALLTQLIYVENYMYLVINLVPRHFLELEHELMALMRCHALFSSPIIVRARALVLVKQACQLKATYNTDGLTHEWVYAFKELVLSVSQYVADTMHLVKMSETLEDQESFVILKYCVIVCLTAEAELHQLLASTGQSEARQSCQDTLAKVVYLTDGLTQEDFIHLDPFLGTCWTKAVPKIMPVDCFLRFPRNNLDHQSPTLPYSFGLSRSDCDTPFSSSLSPTSPTRAYRA